MVITARGRKAMGHSMQRGFWVSTFRKGYVAARIQPMSSLGGRWSAGGAWMPAGRRVFSAWPPISASDEASDESLARGDERRERLDEDGDRVREYSGGGR